MADEDKGKKGSPIKLIAIVTVVAVLLVGGGFFFMKGGALTPGTDGTEAAEGDGGERSDEEGGILYPLEPFIVNLADTPDLRYLKVTITLDLFRPAYASALDTKTPQIRDSILILLSSKDSSSIRSIEGKMELRDEIVQRVNGVFEENMVMTAYFMDFVTQ